MIGAHPKASIPTRKPSTTQEPTSSRARYTMQILQQCRNIVLSFNMQGTQSHTKTIDISKLTIGHVIAFQREIQLHAPEHHTNTSFPKQENLTSHSSNPPTGRNYHTHKKGTINSQNTEGPPQTQNSNQRKVQRNTQQVKEQDKCP